MNARFKVAILVERSLADSIFRREDVEFLHTFADTNPVDELPEAITPEFMMEQLPGAQACITCWRTPTLTDEMLGLSVLVEKASGGKCMRCWCYSDTVGADPEHPDLCERCAKVLA